tara:strand:- start:2125 stop:3390 length:1266 start_codon:yes stop_codon:yes gene_type:complete
MQNLKQIKSIQFSGIKNEILAIVKEISLEAGIEEIAIVGGIVRDYFIKKLHGDHDLNLTDLDIVVKGSASKLAKDIKRKLSPSRVTSIKLFPKFDTAEIILDGLNIDITTARKETYPIPGDDPKTKATNIECDLSRRDFTVNAIAIDLYTNKVIDPFRGLEAIRNREINFIHANSVRDDPTRVFRAARYATKLGFKVNSSSLEQISKTINIWPWKLNNVESSFLYPSGLSVRLTQEIYLLLFSKEWSESINKLQEWKALTLLDQNIQNDKRLKRRIIWGKRLGVESVISLILDSNNPVELAKRLNLPNKQINYICQSLKIKKFLSQLYKNKKHEEWSPSNWCSTIEGSNWHPEAIAMIISTGTPLWQNLFKWWSKWRHIKAPISGKTLISKGFNKGPIIGAELKKLRYTHIDKLYKIKRSN